MKKLVSAFLLPAVLLASPVRAADTQEFLTSDQAVATIVDGTPWNAETAEGVKGKLTLNRDGTGSMDGRVNLSATWKVEGQDLCIKFSLAFVGTKCLRFQPESGRYKGYIGQKLDITLSRG